MIVAALDLMTNPRVDDHLFCGLVHRKELTQFGESLAARVVGRRREHFVEHVFDQIMLVL